MKLGVACLAAVVLLPAAAVQAEDSGSLGPTLEQVKNACPRPWAEVNDELRANPSVLKFPDDGYDAIYLPEVVWKPVRFSIKNSLWGYPKMPVDLSAEVLGQQTAEGAAARQAALDACAAAPGEESMVPYIVRAGAGHGMLVVRDQNFSCTTESVCNFEWAGKHYDLKVAQDRRALKCKYSPEAKGLPRMVKYDITDATRKFFPNALAPDRTNYLWKQGWSLCLPIPKKPGKYNLVFRASHKATKKPATGRFWVCRWTSTTYYCGIETLEVGDETGLAYTGRDDAFSRVVKVTRDSVSIAP